MGAGQSPPPYRGEMTWRYASTGAAILWKVELATS